MGSYGIGGQNTGRPLPVSVELEGQEPRAALGAQTCDTLQAVGENAGALTSCGGYTGLHVPGGVTPRWLRLLTQYSQDGHSGRLNASGRSSGNLYGAFSVGAVCTHDHPV